MTQSRYARQEILDQVGLDGQERLRAARVLLVGLGGLGAPAALYLAAAGVGTLGLVEDDTVELTNIQRQILYRSSDVGLSKLTRAREQLEALNPEVQYRAYAERLTASNALAIAQDYDIIVDGTDNFPSKYLLNDVSVCLRKPLVAASVLRWQGQLAVFWPDHGPCYRCLYPQAPEQGSMNCAEAGVIGALAGILGSLQALETIKLILMGNSSATQLKTLAGRLMLLDGAGARIQTLTIPQDPACPVCAPGAARPTFSSTVSRPSCNSPVREFAAVDLLEGQRWQEFQWIDVRERDEWLTGHIPGCLHWPLSLLRQGPPAQISFRQERPLLLYCQGGMRSREALALLEAQGLGCAGHLRGGLASWMGPLEKGRLTP